MWVGITHLSQMMGKNVPPTLMTTVPNNTFNLNKKCKYCARILNVWKNVGRYGDRMLNMWGKCNFGAKILNVWQNATMVP